MGELGGYVKSLEVLVLDEADRLLDMGFKVCFSLSLTCSTPAVSANAPLLITRTLARVRC